MDWILLIVPLASIIFSGANLWYNKKMKELELADAQRDRKYQLKRTVSEKALAVMGRSYYLVHQINKGLNNYTDANDKEKQDIRQQVRQAREYWEENLFYLPRLVRGKIIPLTNLTFRALHPKGEDSKVDAFGEAFEVFASLQTAFDQLMKEYNLFNDVGDIEITEEIGAGNSQKRSQL